MNSEFFRTGIIILTAFVFIALLVLETVRPLRSLRRPRAGRYLVNAVITTLAFAAGAVAVRPIGLGLAALSSQKSFGLLYLLALPEWMRFVAGFLLMDLTFYFWHRINHEIHLLWRFHSVHHIDPDLDVTTSMRFHFGEVLLSAIFRAVQVLLIGIAPLTYILYETIFTFATLFHHSNLNIPVNMERRLNRVLVTPRMHGIHHSVVRSELNSNYSVIFRWWDALNRSLVLNVPTSALTIGVGRFQRPDDNNILRLIRLPFGIFKKEKPARPPRFGEAGLEVMAE